MSKIRPTEPPTLSQRTTADFTIGGRISQPTAYLMLSALKAVCRIIDEYGPGVLGADFARMATAAMKAGDREANSK